MHFLLPFVLASAMLGQAPAPVETSKQVAVPFSYSVVEVAQQQNIAAAAHKDVARARALLTERNRILVRLQAIEKELNRLNTKPAAVTKNVQCVGECR